MKRPHQISKITLELEVPSVDEANEYQQRASSLFRNQIQKVLEEMLDKYDQPGKIIRIDQLELSLSSFNPEDLPVLKEEIREQLEEQLSGLIRSPDIVNPEVPMEDSSKRNFSVTITEEADDDLRLLLFFFKHGRIPWWNPSVEAIRIQEIFEQLLTNEKNKLIEMLRSELRNETFAKRISRQLNTKTLSTLFVEVFDFEESSVSLLLKEQATRLSPSVLERYFHKMAHSPTSEDYEKIAVLIDLVDDPLNIIGALQSKVMLNSHEAMVIAKSIATAQEVKTEIQLELLKSLSEKIASLNTHQEIQSFLEEHNVTNEVDSSITKTPTLFDAEKLDTEMEDYLLAPNAGLVIAQPFLIPFFTSLELVEDKAFVSNQAQHRAVYLLHHLATGELEQPEEHMLTFPKILCGIELDEPIDAFSGISAEEEKESLELLASIVEHWKALKNTSPQGLQAIFLQREGHVNWSEGAWHLRIERDGPDVLLDQLPWGISMFKISWSDQFLYTEW